MSKNRIVSAEFVMSNTKVSQCPEPNLPEYAFIGRSNVGKSSLINMLTGRKSLAKTSSTPGKTQLINHFIINNTWYLVDLPGYGFAKISKSTRDKWEIMIRDYLRQRSNLMYTCVLIDSRLEPQQNDLNFIEWLSQSQIPICLIFTKADKLSPNKVQSNVAAFIRALKATWEEVPPYFVSSAETGRGKDEILDFIDQWNSQFQNN
jgi:GTP-binding protein